MGQKEHSGDPPWQAWGPSDTARPEPSDSTHLKDHFLNLRLSRVLDARQGQRVSLEGEPLISSEQGREQHGPRGRGLVPGRGAGLEGAGAVQGSAPLRPQLPETKVEPHCTGLGGGLGVAPSGTSAL